MAEQGTPDARLRLAAVEHIKRIGVSGILTSEDLLAGFVVDGARIPLINPRRGIFKLKEMRYLLSVKTVFPKSGGKVWYDDQREVHQQIERGEELVDYAFMKDDPEAADNRWLREARDEQIPIIYFLGVAPARYTAIWPTFVAEWSSQELKARLAFGAPATKATVWLLPAEPERKYGLRLVRQRLHQAIFREAVLAAYDSRCAYRDCLSRGYWMRRISLRTAMKTGASRSYPTDCHSRSCIMRRSTRT